jgi:hypothetical protein
VPKIQWSGLPEALRKHLLLRLKERQVTEQDLLKLMEWRQSEPDAPDGLWYKDFGSFKVCGEGQYPKTFLRGSAARSTLPPHDRTTLGVPKPRSDRGMNRFAESPLASLLPLGPALVLPIVTGRRATAHDRRETTCLREPD